MKVTVNGLPVIFTRRYCRVAKKTNVLKQLKISELNKAAQNRKQLRGDPKVLKRAPNKNNADRDIKDKIRLAKSSYEISTIVKYNKDSITQPSTYGYAIKQCRNKDIGQKINEISRSVIRIMEWLLSSELKPNIVQFNEFFNCLAHAHLPEKCAYYLKIMLEKCQIRPDLILLNTLIKGCRFQARHDFALIYWEMITCYGLVPNEICYTEMISVCARSHHKEHADQLFAEYLEKVENDILPASLATFSAYLHVFSSLGDIGGMEYVLNIIQDYRFKYDAIIVGMMMDTYYNARDGRKALDVCDKYVDGHLIKFNQTLLNYTEMLGVICAVNA
eukprot:1010919_1